MAGNDADVNAPAPFAASPDTFLSEDDAAPRTLFQDETGAEGADGNLPACFAALEPIEADSSLFFGEGKELPSIPGTENTDAASRKQLQGSLRQWAKNHFGQNSSVTNADRGWTVSITPKGIKDTLYHGFDEVLARSVPFIPRIIESGIYLDSIQKKPGLMSHIFANRIRLDGQEYVVGFVLREDGNGNRFYDHELTQIVDPDQLKPVKQREAAAELQTNQDTPQTTKPPVNQGAIMNILRDRLGVNDETDAAPESGRVYPDNGREVGVITEEIAATLALDKPGPIVLDDTGRRHVEERHGKEIRSLGFADAQEFISFVLSHVDAVYAVEGHSRKYDIVSRAMTPQGRVMVRLEFDAAGDYYSVATAGPVRSTQFKNLIPLWEGAHSTLLQQENPWAARRASQRGQSGELRQDAATEINLTAAAPSGKRASVTFQPGGEAVIRLFRGADLSSIPHEAAHIFVEDLLRVAESDGAIARERLRSGLEEVAPADEDLRGLADSALSGSLDTDGLRALLRGVRADMETQADSLRDLRDAAKKAGNDAEAAAVTGAQESARARLAQLRALEPLLAAYVRHLDGVRQARADMATLRRAAGVPENGSLNAESMPMSRAGEQKRATPQTYQRSQMLGNQGRPYGQRPRPLPCLQRWQKKARASIRMRERTNEGSFSP